jgi:hypothetical protein
MIEGIGELTAQQTIRADQQAMTAGQASAVRELVRTAAQRPVEESSDSRKAAAEKEETTESKYNLEHKFPVFEKYGKDGELILQVPPVHEESI